MGYSLGLKTKSHEQAELILAYINKYVPVLTSIFRSSDKNIQWAMGKDLSYISDNSVVGFNLGAFNEDEMSFIYSLFYFLAHKFDTLQDVFDEKHVVIYYDDDVKLIIDNKNPFRSMEYLDDWGYINLNEHNICPIYDSSWLMRLIGSAKNTEKKIEDVILNLP